MPPIILTDAAPLEAVCDSEVCIRGELCSCKALDKTMLLPYEWRARRQHSPDSIVRVQVELPGLYRVVEESELNIFVCMIPGARPGEAVYDMHADVSIEGRLSRGDKSNTFLVENISRLVFHLRRKSKNLTADAIFPVQDGIIGPIYFDSRQLGLE